MAYRNIVTPTVLGLDEVTTAAPRTSNEFDVTGFDRMTVFVHLEETGDTSPATTKVKCGIQFTPDPYNDAGANYFDEQTTTISGGTATLALMSIDKSTGNANIDYAFDVTEMSSRGCRLLFTFDAGNANDTITVTVCGSKDK